MKLFNTKRFRWDKNLNFSGTVRKIFCGLMNQNLTLIYLKVIFIKGIWFSLMVGFIRVTKNQH